MDVTLSLTRASRKQQRRSHILEAAFVEFSLKGYRDAHVADVAKHIGVSKGTIYFHFATKEALFKAATLHALKRLPLLSDNSESDEGAPSERLINLMKWLFDTVRDDEQSMLLFRLLIAESSRIPHIVSQLRENFLDPVLQKITDLLSEGLEAGQFRPINSAFPETIVVSLFCMLAKGMALGIHKDELYCEFNTSIELLMKGLVKRSPENQSQLG